MNKPIYLLDGKPYIPAAHTNIRETFDRVRQELLKQKPLVPILAPDGFVVSSQWFQMED